MKLIEITLSPEALAARYLKHLTHDNLSKELFGTDVKTICAEPGSCSMISNDFQHWLDEQGVKSRVVTGLKAKDLSWVVNAEDDAHTVVLIGNTVIDFTARQFDKKFPLPRVISFSKFKSEWNEID